MQLSKAIIETPITHPDMSVGEALQICVTCWVPGLPFADHTGAIVGRFSVRHTFLKLCIPSDMVAGAHLIGHEAHHLDFPSEHFREVSDHLIDTLIVEEFDYLASNAQISKALALMEKLNSSYLFVIDEGVYRGIVTRLGLTRILLSEQG